MHDVSPRRYDVRMNQVPQNQQPSNKGLFIGLGIGGAVLVVIFVLVTVSLVVKRARAVEPARASTSSTADDWAAAAAVPPAACAWGTSAGMPPSLRWSEHGTGGRRA